MSSPAVKKPSARDLMDAACKNVGLNDFGEPPIEEPLTRHIDAYFELEITERGLQALTFDITNDLQNRLKLEQIWKDHPEILEEDVSDPILIIGLPRSGTTKLHRIMSADPGVQGTPYWRLINPVPFSKEEGSGDDSIDPRITHAEVLCEEMAKIPGLLASTPTIATEAEEDYYIVKQTFDHPSGAIGSVSDSYSEWVDSRSMVATYTYLKKVLQFWQWEDGGKQNGPWVLKGPANLGSVDDMLKVFPNAMVVSSHRDRNQVIASYCRLIEGGVQMFSDTVDLQKIGKFALDFWPKEQAKFDRVRKELEASIPFIDVTYKDIVSNAIDVVAKIHAARSIELSSEAIESMERWEAAKNTVRFGRNEYTLERYGLTEDMVAEAFASSEN